MDSSDFAKGIAFIIHNKDNLLSRCAGPTEAYVVEQTLAALSTRQASGCPTCKGTKRVYYAGYGWCTCEACTVPPLQEGLPTPTAEVERVLGHLEANIHVRMLAVSEARDANALANKLEARVAVLEQLVRDLTKNPDFDFEALGYSEPVDTQ